jgi:glycosyltransferase involved in cell wall biosynthesis
MPRLLIATPTFATQGGVERILAALATGLPRHGFEVVFALAKGSRFHDSQRFLAAFPPVRSVELDGTSGTSQGRRRAIRNAVEQVRPDIMLAARLFEVLPVVAELKHRGSPVRFAITIQAYEAEYLYDAARYASFIDACVTSGKLIARAASEIAGLPPDRVRSIPGGVEPAHRPVISNGGPLRLGYVGRVEETQKRALDLADTLIELQRLGVAFTLTIAGDGSARAELERRLAAAGIPAVSRGWLDTAELYESVYPELDVLLHFAEWEGITIAPREAMAHGVVPVVSRFTGLATEGELVDGENALTFAVGDTAAAAAVVARLDRDRALLAELSSNARLSQSGIRSAQGAVAAWAETLQMALAQPARVGETLPREPVDSGRLADLGIPPPIADALRRAMGRTQQHTDPGAEWPHWSGVTDAVMEKKIAELAKDA